MLINFLFAISKCAFYGIITTGVRLHLFSPIIASAR